MHSKTFYITDRALFFWQGLFFFLFFFPFNFYIFQLSILSMLWKLNFSNPFLVTKYLQSHFMLSMDKNFDVYNVLQIGALDLFEVECSCRIILLFSLRNYFSPLEWKWYFHFSSNLSSSIKREFWLMSKPLILL